MIDKRTLQSAAVGLIAVNLAQGINWKNELYVKIAFTVFNCCMFAIVTAYVVVRRKIVQENDQKQVVVETSTYKELTTAAKFDLRHLKQTMAVFLIGTSVIYVMYVGFNIVPALVMHSFFCVTLFFTDPVFQIHLLKRKAVGDLARPFNAAPLFEEGGKVQEVKTLDELNSKLQSAGKKLVVIDFYAEWCRPCRQIAPGIEEMAVGNTDVVFLRSDVDKAQEVAAKYNVNKVPHFAFIRNKEKVHDVVGGPIGRIESAVTEYRKAE